MTVSVLCFFLMVRRVGLQCVIVVFSGHSYFFSGNQPRDCSLAKRARLQFVIN